MLQPTDDVVGNLIMAFMQFHKIDWQRKIEGYKPSEIRLLICIQEAHGSLHHEMKVSEISKSLLITPPSVTQLLNKLEKDELITRRMDEQDRRVVLVRLTEKGKYIAEKGKEDFRRLFCNLVATLGDKESKELTQLLTKVYKFFNEDNVRS